MDDKKAIEQIYQLLTRLEHDEPPFDVQFIDDIKNQISKLSASTDPIAIRLSKYADSIKTDMTYRSLATICVPFERYLKRSITDDDIVISHTDRDHLVTPRVPLYFILDHLRSAFNVGSIFRTADTLGAKKIFLTGYTPTPHQIQVERAALGATAVIEWEQTTFSEAIESLKKLGTQIIALETTSDAVDIGIDFDFTKPTAFIFGNERFGLEKDQLKMADQIRKIPTYGIKNSLNVGVAMAITGYEWRKQFQESLVSKGIPN